MLGGASVWGNEDAGCDTLSLSDSGTAACDPNRTSRFAVWMARKPEAYLFSTEACLIALLYELPPLPAQECMTTLYPR
jgi:hypothetical protein